MKLHRAEFAWFRNIDVCKSMAGYTGITVKDVPMRIALAIVGYVNTF